MSDSAFGINIAFEGQESVDKLHALMRQDAWEVEDTRLIVFDSSAGLPLLWVKPAYREACLDAIEKWTAANYTVSVGFMMDYPETVFLEDEQSLFALLFGFTGNPAVPDQTFKIIFSAEDHLSFLMALQQYKRLLILAEECDPALILDRSGTLPAFLLEFDASEPITRFVAGLANAISIE